MKDKLLNLKKCIVISALLAWPVGHVEFFSFAFAQNSDSGSSIMMGIKVEDSEDMNDAAKMELKGDGGGQLVHGPEETLPLTSQEKANIVIIKPPTLEEKARMVREEIEIEKSRKILRKIRHSTKFKDAGKIGQTSDSDTVGADAGGGGGGDEGLAIEDAGWTVEKPTCLDERAKMEMAEVLAAKKQRGQGPGQGGGVGGGSGAGTGSGMGDETGMMLSSPRLVKKVCKSKDMYECMAQEAKERALQEQNNPDQMEGNGGDDVTLDGGQGESEVKYKRPPVRFKTQAELEAEAQKIMQEDTLQVGEQRVESDQVIYVPSVTVTRPTMEEHVRQVQSELEAAKESRQAGPDGEVKTSPTQDLE